MDESCASRTRPTVVTRSERAGAALPGPDDHDLLDDLGWTLVEAGRPEEAVPVLLRAVERAPADYEFARNNLAEARRQIERAGRRARRRLRKAIRPD